MTTGADPTRPYALGRPFALSAGLRCPERPDTLGAGVIALPVGAGVELSSFESCVTAQVQNAAVPNPLVVEDRAGVIASHELHAA